MIPHESYQYSAGNADRPKEENVEHVLGLVEQAPSSDLILLPEIWPCGFFSFDRYQQDSETIDGLIVTAFKEMARQRKCHIFMGSMVENDGGHLFNSSILLNSSGEVAARYRKIHLFGYQSGLERPKNLLILTHLPNSHRACISRFVLCPSSATQLRQKRTP